MVSVRYWSVDLQIEWTDPCQPTWALSCPAETHIRKVNWDESVVPFAMVEKGHNQEIVDRAKGLIKRLKGNHVNRIGNAKEIRLVRIKAITQERYDELTSSGKVV